MKSLFLLVLASAAAAQLPDVYPLAGASPAATAIDQQGNIYVAGITTSTQFPIAGNALQATLKGNSDAFVAKFSSAGELLWSTYFGGSDNDQATGVAVDSVGNVLVAGITSSNDLPVLNAIQSTPGGRDDAFVLKLDPGGKLLYSTYLGGAADDQAYGIAVDSSGAAYVTGLAGSVTLPGQSPVPYLFQGFVTKLAANGALVYSFQPPGAEVIPHAIAVDGSGSAYLTGFISGATSALSQGFVLKVSPDGSKVTYQKTFGGSQGNQPQAIAIDASGAAYVAGVTTSVDFPVVSPVQAALGARPLWKSTDGGNSWTPADNLPFALPQALVADPTAAQTLYVAASDTGAFRSTDGGLTFASLNHGIGDLSLYSLVLNPSNPGELYAGAGAGEIYASTDGGAAWSLLHSFAGTLAAVTVQVDPQQPSILYATGATAYKSTDGGNSWNSLPQPTFGIAQLLVDPVTEGTLYAYTNGTAVCCFGFAQPTLVRSTNGGASWQVVNTTAYAPGILADPTTKPATTYDGMGARSNDGTTWTPLTAPPGIASYSVSAMAVDPRNGTVYVAGGNPVVMDESANQGQSWTPIPTPAQMPVLTGIVPTAGALYATSSTAFGSAFVLKLSPDGSTILYSTFLGGHAGTPQFADQWQNQANGIALDPAGNIVVAGYTLSPDFPMVNAAQSTLAGPIDAFLSLLSPDGQQIGYSTYLGGANGAQGTAVAAGAHGDLIVAGTTASASILGTAIPADKSGSGFLARFHLSAPAPTPVITKVVSAASFLPPIEAGSWVMIQGTGLANGTRLWQSSDFSGNNLPTQLDGVSVTIDGRPAFVEYISPTQINVQAPDDSATGAVNVVVTNNGHASVPMTAQLQTVAPALFMTPTYHAIASTLPGYTPVTAAAPARPGDLVILWGTGFGPTDPPASAGTIVSGAPATATLPAVTVGGVEVPVVSAVLTTGEVGTYQITIRLPANVPARSPLVRVSVGSAQTQDGVTLFVGAQ